ncbi:CapA family protein [Streptomyces sp. NPDC018045]|uniref:CapA family protein n=1 Tax=Streptomyces sp. NPDC018045 TaxID=3365037 RepID=UPI00378F189D
MTSFTLAAAGDVLIDRPRPATALAAVAPLLNGADLAFANFEGVLTDTQEPAPGSAHATVVPTANADGLHGLDVVSLANNHSMDAGHQGLRDTLTALHQRAIRTAGAGRTLEEALTPAVFDHPGHRTTVLALTSVFRIGVEARRNVPGVAPLRADEYHAARIPGVHNPGLTPRTLTVLNDQDWHQVHTVLSAARTHTDHLVVSVHWGDHTRPWTLTDHERTCARRLIEAGADVVLGHHQHFLRGMEFIDGKPVFYGLGHLVFDHPRFLPEMTAHGIDMEGLSPRELSARFGEFGIYPRPQTPTLPFHPLTRHTGIAVIETTSDRDTPRVAMAPCYLDTEGTPRPVTPDSPHWHGCVTFLRACQEKAALKTHVTDHGRTVNGLHVLDFAPTTEETAR